MPQAGGPGSYSHVINLSVNVAGALQQLQQLESRARTTEKSITKAMDGIRSALAIGARGSDVKGLFAGVESETGALSQALRTSVANAVREGLTSGTNEGLVNIERSITTSVRLAVEIGVIQALQNVQGIIGETIESGAASAPRNTPRGYSEQPAMVVTPPVQRVASPTNPPDPAYRLATPGQEIADSRVVRQVVRTSGSASDELVSWAKEQGYQLPPGHTVREIAQIPERGEIIDIGGKRHQVVGVGVGSASEAAMRKAQKAGYRLPEDTTIRAIEAARQRAMEAAAYRQQAISTQRTMSSSQGTMFELDAWNSPIPEIAATGAKTKAPSPASVRRDQIRRGNQLSGISVVPLSDKEYVSKAIEQVAHLFGSRTFEGVEPLDPQQVRGMLGGQVGEPEALAELVQLALQEKMMQMESGGGAKLSLSTLGQLVKSGPTSKARAGSWRGAEQYRSYQHIFGSGSSINQPMARAFVEFANQARTLLESGRGKEWKNMRLDNLWGVQLSEEDLLSHLLPLISGPDVSIGREVMMPTTGKGGKGVGKADFIWRDLLRSFYVEAAGGVHQLGALMGVAPANVVKGTGSYPGMKTASDAFLWQMLGTGVGDLEQFRRTMDKELEYSQAFPGWGSGKGIIPITGATDLGGGLQHIMSGMESIVDEPSKERVLRQMILSHLGGLHKKYQRPEIGEAFAGNVIRAGERLGSITEAEGAGRWEVYNEKGSTRATGPFVLEDFIGTAAGIIGRVPENANAQPIIEFLERSVGILNEMPAQGLPGMSRREVVGTRNIPMSQELWERFLLSYANRYLIPNYPISEDELLEFAEKIQGAKPGQFFDSRYDPKKHTGPVVLPRSMGSSAIDRAMSEMQSSGAFQLSSGAMARIPGNMHSTSLIDRLGTDIGKITSGTTILTGARGTLGGGGISAYGYDEEQAAQAAEMMQRILGTEAQPNLEQGMMELIIPSEYHRSRRDKLRKVPYYKQERAIRQAAQLFDNPIVTPGIGTWLSEGAEEPWIEANTSIRGYPKNAQSALEAVGFAQAIQEKFRQDAALIGMRGEGAPHAWTTSGEFKNSFGPTSADAYERYLKSLPSVYKWPSAVTRGMRSSSLKPASFAGVAKSVYSPESRIYNLSEPLEGNRQIAVGISNFRRGIFPYGESGMGESPIYSEEGAEDIEPMSYENMLNAVGYQVPGRRQMHDFMQQFTSDDHDPMMYDPDLRDDLRDIMSYKEQRVIDPWIDRGVRGEYPRYDWLYNAARTIPNDWWNYLGSLSAVGAKTPGLGQGLQIAQTLRSSHSTPERRRNVILGPKSANSPGDTLATLWHEMAHVVDFSAQEEMVPFSKEQQEMWEQYRELASQADRSGRDAFAREYGWDFPNEDVSTIIEGLVTSPNMRTERGHISRPALLAKAQQNDLLRRRIGLLSGAFDLPRGVGAFREEAERSMGSASMRDVRSFLSDRGIAYNAPINVYDGLYSVRRASSMHGGFAEDKSINALELLQNLGKMPEEWLQNTDFLNIHKRGPKDVFAEARNRNATVSGMRGISLFHNAFTSPPGQLRLLDIEGENQLSTIAHELTHIQEFEAESVYQGDEKAKIFKSHDALSHMTKYFTDRRAREISPPFAYQYTVPKEQYPYVFEGYATPYGSVYGEDAATIVESLAAGLSPDLRQKIEKPDNHIQRMLAARVGLVSKLYDVPEHWGGKTQKIAQNFGLEWMRKREDPYSSDWDSGDLDLLATMPSPGLLARSMGASVADVRGFLEERGVQLNVPLSSPSYGWDDIRGGLSEDFDADMLLANLREMPDHWLEQPDFLNVYKGAEENYLGQSFSKTHTQTGLGGIALYKHAGQDKIDQRSVLVHELIHQQDNVPFGERQARDPNFYDLWAGYESLRDEAAGVVEGVYLPKTLQGREKLDLNDVARDYFIRAYGQNNPYSEDRTTLVESFAGWGRGWTGLDPLNRDRLMSPITRMDRNLAARLGIASRMHGTPHWGGDFQRKLENYGTEWISRRSTPRRTNYDDNDLLDEMPPPREMGASRTLTGPTSASMDDVRDFLREHGVRYNQPVRLYDAKGRDDYSNHLFGGFANDEDINALQLLNNLSSMSGRWLEGMNYLNIHKKGLRPGTAGMANLHRSGMKGISLFNNAFSTKNPLQMPFSGISGISDQKAILAHEMTHIQDYKLSEQNIAENSYAHRMIGGYNALFSGAMQYAQEIAALKADRNGMMLVSEIPQVYQGFTRQYGASIREDPATIAESFAVGMSPDLQDRFTNRQDTIHRLLFARMGIASSLFKMPKWGGDIQRTAEQYGSMWLDSRKDQSSGVMTRDDKKLLEELPFPTLLFDEDRQKRAMGASPGQSPFNITQEHIRGLLDFDYVGGLSAEKTMSQSDLKYLREAQEKGVERLRLRGEHGKHVPFEQFPYVGTSAAVIPFRHSGKGFGPALDVARQALQRMTSGLDIEVPTDAAGIAGLFEKLGAGDDIGVDAFRERMLGYRMLPEEFQKIFDPEWRGAHRPLSALGVKDISHWHPQSYTASGRPAAAHSISDLELVLDEFASTGSMFGAENFEAGGAEGMYRLTAPRAENEKQLRFYRDQARNILQIIGYLREASADPESGFSWQDVERSGAVYELMRNAGWGVAPMRMSPQMMGPMAALMTAGTSPSSTEATGRAPTNFAYINELKLGQSTKQLADADEQLVPVMQRVSNAMARQTTAVLDKYDAMQKLLITVKELAQHEGTLSQTMMNAATVTRGDYNIALKKDSPTGDIGRFLRPDQVDRLKTQYGMARGLEGDQLDAEWNTINRSFQQRFGAWRSQLVGSGAESITPQALKEGMRNVFTESLGDRGGIGRAQAEQMVAAAIGRGGGAAAIPGGGGGGGGGRQAPVGGRDYIVRTGAEYRVALEEISKEMGLATHQMRQWMRDTGLPESAVRGRIGHQYGITVMGPGDQPLAQHIIPTQWQGMGPGFQVNQGNMAEQATGVQRLGLTVEKVGMWGVATGVVYNFLRALRDAVSTMTQFEDQMAGAKVLMPLTTNWGQLADFAGETAREYGTSIMQVMDATRSWMRQYKDLNQVLDMTRQAIKLSRVDNIDLGQANKYLEATINEFNLSASSAERIVDSWTNVTNNAQVAMTDLAAGISRSGAAAKIAGVDFDELNGLIAAGVRATGETGNQVGQMLKTMFGKMYTDTAVQTLQGLGIAVGEVREGVTQLRPAGDILDELATVWTKLSRAQQQDVAMSMAGGVRQWSRLAAMLSEYRTAMDATEASQNAFGQASREVSIRMDTVTGSMSKLRGAWSSLIGDLSFHQNVLLPIRLSIDAVTGLLDRFREMPDVIQAGLIATAALAAKIATLNLLFRAFGAGNILDVGGLWYGGIGAAGLGPEPVAAPHFTGSQAMPGIMGRSAASARSMGASPALQTGAAALSGYAAAGFGRGMEATAVGGSAVSAARGIGWGTAASKGFLYGFAPPSNLEGALGSLGGRGASRVWDDLLLNAKQLTAGLSSAAGKMARFGAIVLLLLATMIAFNRIIDYAKNVFAQRGMTEQEREKYRIEKGLEEGSAYLEAMNELSALRAKESPTLQEMAQIEELEKRAREEKKPSFGSDLQSTEMAMSRLSQLTVENYLGKAGSLGPKQLLEMQGEVANAPRGMGRIGSSGWSQLTSEVMVGTSREIQDQQLRRAALDSFAQMFLEQYASGDAEIDAPWRVPGITLSEINKQMSGRDLLRDREEIEAALAQGVKPGGIMPVMLGRYNREDTMVPVARTTRGFEAHIPGMDEAIVAPTLQELARKSEEAGLQIDALIHPSRSVATEFINTSKNLAVLNKELSNISNSLALVRNAVSLTARLSGPSGVSGALNRSQMSAMGSFVRPTEQLRGQALQRERYIIEETLPAIQGRLQRAVDAAMKTGAFESESAVLQYAQSRRLSGGEVGEEDKDEISAVIESLEKQEEAVASLQKAQMDRLNAEQQLLEIEEQLRKTQESSLEYYNVWSRLSRSIDESRQAAWGYFEAIKSIREQQEGMSNRDAIGLGGISARIAARDRRQQVWGSYADAVGSARVSGEAAYGLAFGGVPWVDAARPRFSTEPAIAGLRSAMAQGGTIGGTDTSNVGQALMATASIFDTAVARFEQAVGHFSGSPTSPTAGGTQWDYSGGLGSLSNVPNRGSGSLLSSGDGVNIGAHSPSDPLLIRARPGEAVLNQRAVRSLGARGIERLNRLPGYQGGGIVGGIEAWLSSGKSASGLDPSIARELQIAGILPDDFINEMRKNPRQARVILDYLRGSSSSPAGIYLPQESNLGLEQLSGLRLQLQKARVITPDAPSGWSATSSGLVFPESSIPKSPTLNLFPESSSVQKRLFDIDRVSRTRSARSVLDPMTSSGLQESLPFQPRFGGGNEWQRGVEPMWKRSLWRSPAQDLQGAISDGYPRAVGELDPMLESGARTATELRKTHWWDELLNGRTPGGKRVSPSILEAMREKAAERELAGQAAERARLEWSASGEMMGEAGDIARGAPADDVAEASRRFGRISDWWGRTRAGRASGAIRGAWGSSLAGKFLSQADKVGSLKLPLARGPLLLEALAGAYRGAVMDPGEAIDQGAISFLAGTLGLTGLALAGVASIPILPWLLLTAAVGGGAQALVGSYRFRKEYLKTGRVASNENWQAWLDKHQRALETGGTKRRGSYLRSIGDEEFARRQQRIMGSIARFAHGGVVGALSGIAYDETEPQDKVLTALQPGEYVIRKSVVDKVGKGPLDRLNAGDLAGAMSSAVKRQGGGIISREEMLKRQKPGWFMKAPIEDVREWARQTGTRTRDWTTPFGWGQSEEEERRFIASQAAMSATAMSSSISDASIERHKQEKQQPFVASRGFDTGRQAPARRTNLLAGLQAQELQRAMVAALTEWDRGQPQARADILRGTLENSIDRISQTFSGLRVSGVNLGTNLGIGEDTVTGVGELQRMSLINNMMKRSGWEGMAQSPAQIASRQAQQAQQAYVGELERAAEAANEWATSENQQVSQMGRSMGTVIANLDKFGTGDWQHVINRIPQDMRQTVNRWAQRMHQMGEAANELQRQMEVRQVFGEAGEGARRLVGGVSPTGKREVGEIEAEQYANRLMGLIAPTSAKNPFEMMQQEAEAAASQMADNFQALFSQTRQEGVAGQAARTGLRAIEAYGRGDAGTYQELMRSLAPDLRATVQDTLRLSRIAQRQAPREGEIEESIISGAFGSPNEQWQSYMEGVFATMMMNGAPTILSPLTYNMNTPSMRKPYGATSRGLISEFGGAAQQSAYGLYPEGTEYRESGALGGAPAIITSPIRGRTSSEAVGGRGISPAETLDDILVTFGSTWGFVSAPEIVPPEEWMRALDRIGEKESPREWIEAARQMSASMQEMAQETRQHREAYERGINVNVSTEHNFRLDKGIVQDSELEGADNHVTAQQRSDQDNIPQSK